METFKNMEVCQIDFDNWGDDQDPTSNWSLCIEHASFSHKDACEFIFYIGDDRDIQNLKSLGFTDDFILLCTQAKRQCYRYICFYN